MAEQAKLRKMTFSYFCPGRVATSPVLFFGFSCCNKQHAIDSWLYLP